MPPFDYEYFVLEISSFQLDDIEQFAPHIAVITNITPDHLDRYHYDFTAYIQAKLKITQNQTPKNFFAGSAGSHALASVARRECGSGIRSAGQGGAADRNGRGD